MLSRDMPADFFFVCNKIMLKNPHILLMKTDSDFVHHNYRPFRSILLILITLYELCKVI